MMSAKVIRLRSGTQITYVDQVLSLRQLVNRSRRESVVDQQQEFDLEASLNAINNLTLYSRSRNNNFINSR